MQTVSAVEPPKANPENLLRIVSDAHAGKVVVPEFQRSFVWSREDIEELLISIVQGYFIGTFLFLDTQPASSLFPFRLMEGLEELGATADAGRHPTVRVILDGQQRITSVFYALYEPHIPLRNARNPYRFFFRVDRALDRDPTDAVLGVSRIDTARMRDMEDLVSEWRAVPFSLFRDTSPPLEWLYRDQRCWKGEDVHTIRIYFDRVTNFMVPVVAISPETGKDNIVNIFERINRTGIRLSLFDLAAARLYPKGLKLRELWDAFEQSHRSAAEVIKPEYMLRLLAVCDGKEPRRATMLDVVDALDADQFRARWETATHLMIEAYQRVTSAAGYGAFEQKWIPYTTLLVPLAALLGWLEKHHAGADRYLAVDRWYWASVFTQRYDHAVDTTTFRDVKQVGEWLGGGDQPDWLARPSPGVPDLDVDEPGSAVYRGLMCLIVLAGAKDFVDGQQAVLRSCHDDHLFPKSQFGEHRSVNSILNRTLISSRTNEVKGRRKPSEYLRRFIESHGQDRTRFEHTLQTHLIPPEAIQAMECDDLDRFLQLRQAAFREAIQARLGEHQPLT